VQDSSFLSSELHFELVSPMTTTSSTILLGFSAESSIIGMPYISLPKRLLLSRAERMFHGHPLHETKDIVSHISRHALAAENLLEYRSNKFRRDTWIHTPCSILESSFWDSCETAPECWNLCALSTDQQSVEFPRVGFSNTKV